MCGNSAGFQTTNWCALSRCSWNCDAQWQYRKGLHIGVLIEHAIRILETFSICNFDLFSTSTTMGEGLGGGQRLCLIHSCVQRERWFNPHPKREISIALSDNLTSTHVGYNFRICHWPCPYSTHMMTYERCNKHTDLHIINTWMYKNIGVPAPRTSTDCSITGGSAGSTTIASTTPPHSIAPRRGTITMLTYIPTYNHRYIHHPSIHMYVRKYSTYSTYMQVHTGTNITVCGHTHTQTDTHTHTHLHMEIQSRCQHTAKNAKHHAVAQWP